MPCKTLNEFIKLWNMEKIFNCEIAQGLIADFWAKNLIESQKNELEKHLEGCADCQEAWEFAQTIRMEYAALPMPEPSAKLQEEFEQILKKYKNKSSFWEQWATFFKQLFMPEKLPVWGYSLALLVIGFGIGYWSNKPQQADNQLAILSAEVQTMREMMVMTLIKQPSATKRLQAVSMTQDLSSVDAQVIEAMFFTLNHDENVNVRLATLETLYQWADRPAVREGLIKAISQQDSPMVQITIAEMMVALQEKKSAESFRKLLENKNLDQNARQQIEKSLKVLL